jgi:hypothetical protein
MQIAKQQMNCTEGNRYYVIFIKRDAASWDVM